jgi:hypothetical protein
MTKIVLASKVPRQCPFFLLVEVLLRVKLKEVMEVKG